MRVLSPLNIVKEDGFRKGFLFAKLRFACLAVGKVKNIPQIAV